MSSSELIKRTAYELGLIAIEGAKHEEELKQNKKPGRQRTSPGGIRTVKYTQK